MNRTKISNKIILDKLIDTFDSLAKAYVVEYDVLEEISQMYLSSLNTDEDNFEWFIDSNRQYLGLGNKVLKYSKENPYRRFDEKKYLPVQVPTKVYRFYPNRPRFVADPYEPRFGVEDPEKDVYVEVSAVDRNFARKISEIYFGRPDAFETVKVPNNDYYSNTSKYYEGAIEKYLARVTIKEIYPELIKAKETGDKLLELTNDEDGSYHINDRIIDTVFKLEESIFKWLIQANPLLRKFQEMLWYVLNDVFGIQKHELNTKGDTDLYTMIISDAKMFMTIEIDYPSIRFKKENIGVFNPFNNPSDISLYYGTFSGGYLNSYQNISSRYLSKYKPSIMLKISHGAKSLDNSTTIDMFDPECVIKICNLINVYYKININIESRDKAIRFLEKECKTFKAIKDLKECCNMIIYNSDYIKLDKKIDVNPKSNIMITLDDNDIMDIENNQLKIIFKKKVPTYHNNIDNIYVCDKQGRVFLRCKCDSIANYKDVISFAKNIKPYNVGDRFTKTNTKKYFNDNYKAYLISSRTTIPGIDIENFGIKTPPISYQFIRSISYNDKTDSLVKQVVRENSRYTEPRERTVLDEESY